MAITLTPPALERVQRFLQQDSAALGLRFGVERSGCSGWGHKADLARDQRDRLLIGARAEDERAADFIQAV